MARPASLGLEVTPKEFGLPEDWSDVYREDTTSVVWDHSSQKTSSTTVVPRVKNTPVENIVSS